MKADTAQAIDELFRQGVLGGDADGLAELYEPDAVLYDAGPAFEFRGRPAIREHYRQVFTQLRASGFDLDTQVVEMGDGLAYAHGTGTIHTDSAPPLRLRVMDVRRRGADGLWRLALDHVSMQANA